MTGKLGVGVVFAVLALVFAFEPSAHGQIAGSSARPMITSPIVENTLVRLPGNVRPEANATNDRGPVPGTLPMQHMLLQLQRPASQEQALKQLIDQLHDPNSANFQHWLTPNQFGTQFGPAASDIAQITAWLQNHGFSVDVTYPSGMTIDFSGTADQVSAAFHTEIHYVQAGGGALHFANMSNPQIPAALAPAIAGVVSLHDFAPRPSLKPKQPSGQTSKPFLTTSSGSYLVTPPDLATIYNFNPVFASGNTGQNQTIHLIENTDIFATSDWTTFRSAFGLSGYAGASLNTVHPAPPSGTNNCNVPVDVDGGQAILDAEYASAGAPSASIVMATCADSGATFGGLIAIQNLINGANPPAIISLGYAACEATNGAASNAAYNAIYQQGVAEGVSIFVAAGDDLAGVCDGNGASAVSLGISVNAYASTPYNVAVGGTDFSDSYSGTISTYWKSTNSATFGSAKSYVPEIPWNNSCASQLLATTFNFATTYGSFGFCNDPNDGIFYQTNTGGSGGPSGCATGTGATCAGYAKPSWQSGVLGIPNDGVRDLPDVSLFAGNGIWNHSYVFCWSDVDNGGALCSGTPDPLGVNPTWSSRGGTAFATAIMAGVQALVNQKAGARQGNPNYRLYQLAAKEYGVSGSSSCNSSNGNMVGGSCIFYDVTLGDNDAPCVGSINCYTPSGTIGVLSTSNNSYAPAYSAKTGWDFATGIGTINVSNLVTNWALKAVTATHDFNGDGKSDIAWRDTSGNAAVWLMSGATLLQSGGLGSAPAAWSVVGQRDFDANGKFDWLWHDSSGNVAIWFMNGTVVTQSSGVGNVSTAWSIVGTGDFNGDGKGDILWRDTSGNVGVWLMNGATLSQSAGLGSAPTTWTIVGTGDFDGDGKSDVLWHDSSGNVAIWFMNGTLVTQSSGVGNVSTAWSIVGTGDFNGDGKSDILWRDTAGNVGVWLMNGAALSQSAGLGSAPTSWTIVETGDYDGDGKSDVLWHDSSGNVAIWFMNGTVVTQSTGVGNVSTAWSIQGAGAN